MGSLFLAAMLCLNAAVVLPQVQQDASAAQTVAPPSAAPPPPSATPQNEQAGEPLPPLRELLFDVERNQKALEAIRKSYTYRVHLEEQELDKKGSLKKTEVTDSQSVRIDGVLVNRVLARNGKPLTPEEAQKEDERIDKEVAKDKARRAKREGKGEDTDSSGNVMISTARILELGKFTNPRRVDFYGRPTIVADYAGDPAAKTHNAAEGFIRALVGTVWIDEKDHVLVGAQGHFVDDFKIGGGLLLNIHKGLSFEFRATLVNGEVWLPATTDAQGSARFLLFGGVNGRIHLQTSDYRKFHTESSVIVSSNGEIDANGVPVEAPKSTTTPAPAAPPQTMKTQEGRAAALPSCMVRFLAHRSAPKAEFS